MWHFSSHCKPICDFNLKIKKAHELLISREQLVILSSIQQPRICNSKFQGVRTFSGRENCEPKKSWGDISGSLFLHRQCSPEMLSCKFELTDAEASALASASEGKGRRARSLRFIRPQTSSTTTICALKLRPTHAYLLVRDQVSFKTFFCQYKSSSGFMNWKSVPKDNQIYFPPKVVNSVDDRVYI
ncbi:hypothetical protein Avbf_18254 [Armadillidium vulgare]|nr:hypothetical protein Avbf_18254 [Armadillidium vulgare]